MAKRKPPDLNLSLFESSIRPRKEFLALPKKKRDQIIQTVSEYFPLHNPNTRVKSSSSEKLPTYRMDLRNAVGNLLVYYAPEKLETLGAVLYARVLRNESITQGEFFPAMGYFPEEVRGALGRVLNHAVFAKNELVKYRKKYGKMEVGDYLPVQTDHPISLLFFLRISPMGIRIASENAARFNGFTGTLNRRIIERDAHVNRLLRIFALAEPYFGKTVPNIVSR